MADHLVCEAPRRPYMLAKNEGERLAVIFRPRCKSWSCPACSQINKSLWMVRAHHGASELRAAGYELYFLTLTSHEKLTPNQSLWVWPKAWGKLRDRIRYENGGSFQYLMVPERHLSGKLHVHAVETAGLTERRIKTLARESGLGYMADESIIRSPAGAAFYAGKYLSKQLEFQAWPKGFRRVRTSQAWPKLTPEPSPVGWRFEMLPSDKGIDQTVDYLGDAGYWVNVLDHYMAWEVVNGMIDANGEVLES